MIARAARLIAAAAVMLTAAVFVPQTRAQKPDAALHLLDVPFLPQSEDLCGGAAVAMVMRFWGASDMYAEAFSGLVDRSAGGIRGQDLLQALQSRGWQAASFRGDAPLVQSQLAGGRPVVALIQDRPGRFHYVVIVGWSAGRVIVHDPARAPFRILDQQQFTSAWSEAGYWMLVATPTAPTAPSGGQPLAGRATPEAESHAALPSPLGGQRLASRATPESESPAVLPSLCSPMVAEGVRLSGTGDLESARRLLEMAAANCPGSAAPWRELAGLHVLKTEWREAARDARRALANDSTDALASRILATALYLEGNSDRALDAWNQVGEPLLDLVNVTGLERTRYVVVAREMGLHPQTLLTRAAVQAARRRLAELPAAQTTRVGYRPGENGRAQVDAAVLERPLLPASPLMLGAIGVRSITDREIAAGIASPSGGGELWSVAWRWWEHRPRVAVGLAAPAPFGGVWRVDGFHERQSYHTAGAVFEETRRRAAMHVSDWTLNGVRWEAETGVDSWRGAARSVSLGATGQQRFADERLTLEARAAGWLGGVRTWSLGLRSEWRTTTRNEGDVWIGRAGLDLTGNTAPFALWPGAGTGQGRDVLLRAHTLLHDGIIGDSVIGRRLAHAGTEWRRWMQPRGKPVRVAPALFLDAARAGHLMEGADGRFHLDAGAGLRIAVPGAGVLRVDLARGVRDGATAFSVGWTK